jgi:hypothetical protein
MLLTTSNPQGGASLVGNAAMALCLAAVLGASSVVSADEADAKRLLKSMSDFMADQNTFSVVYDAGLEVVTVDDQKLELTSSGTLVLRRPNKLQATRVGGFSDVEMFFNGRTLTLLGKEANAYAQVAAPGTIDELLEQLQLKYGFYMPASDLMLTNPYDVLMSEVVDVKDLGTGVVAGVKCDHLAFRTEQVDWQIWIAEGEKPFPCRYSITSTQVKQGPQYTIQFSDWKAGSNVAPAEFRFTNKTKATKVELGDIENADQLPAHYKTTGEAK